MDKTVVILIGAGVCCVVIGFAMFVKLLTTKSNDDDETTGNRKLLDEEYAENMAAAVWFHDISERGEISDDELRYVELMLIEMSNFYFDNLKNIHPSGKCLDSIKKIYRDIQEAGLCTKS